MIHIVAIYHILSQFMIYFTAIHTSAGGEGGAGGARKGGQMHPLPERGLRHPGVPPKVQGAGFRVQGSSSRIQDSGFGVYRVQGPGSRLQGPGFRIQGSGSRVRVLGF